MQRIGTQRQAEAIQAAFNLLPAPTADRLAAVHILCADPILVGFHHTCPSTDDRSYRDTAHVCYPWDIDRPASERVTTVVLPPRDGSNFHPVCSSTNSAMSSTNS
jgi:hypothetical protein